MVINLRYFFIFLFLTLPCSVWAEEDVTGRQLPKIEAGVAFLNFYIPDYPGAEESTYRFLPAPYVIYRGDIFRADREGGYRGRFIKKENFEFDVSASASFPSNAEDNEARRDMEDLDWLGEFGPRFKYMIVKTPIIKLEFELPVRYVFSTDLMEFNSRGYTINPELSMQHRALFDVKGFFNLSLIGMWATEDLLDYFYEVPTDKALADRPAYDADGGFMGYSMRLTYIRPIQDSKYVLFAGAARTFYADAENRSSPLLRDIETESYYLGFAWRMYQSDEKSDEKDVTQ